MDKTDIQIEQTELSLDDLNNQLEKDFVDAEAKIHNPELSNMIINGMYNVQNQDDLETHYSILEKLELEGDDKGRILGFFEGKSLNNLDKGFLIDVFDNDIDFLKKIFGDEVFTECSFEEKLRKLQHLQNEIYVSPRMYIHTIFNYPLLTREEEIYLARKIAKGDMYAREMFICANLKLSIMVANRYFLSSLKNMEFLDLVQEGNIGLMKAVEKFDYKKGYKFSTYAVWWIKQSIRRGLNQQERLIRIPENSYSDYLSKKKVMKELAAKKGDAISEEEVCERLGLSAEKIAYFNYIDYLGSISSLDIPLEKESGGVSTDTIMNFLIDTNAVSPEEDSVRKVFEDYVVNVLDSLKPREKDIIMKRYGFGGRSPMTQEVIGEGYGLTRQRIQQIEVKALRRLRYKIDLDF